MTLPNLWLFLLLSMTLNYLLFNYLYRPTQIVASSIVYVEEDTEKRLHNVPLLCQLPTLPTGCEAASTAMLLNWYGLDVSMTEIANQLPKKNLPSEKNGLLIGGNPNEGFVGDSYLTTGFGVFHKPIAQLIDGYLPGRSRELTGCSFETLLNVINKGYPVIVWATIDMAEPSINSTWLDENGEEVVWKVPEHAMVLIGYNTKEIIVQDPLVGETRYFNLAQFRSCWEYMGSQAVTLKVN